MQRTRYLSFVSFLIPMAFLVCQSQRVQADPAAITRGKPAIFVQLQFTPTALPKDWGMGNSPLLDVLLWLDHLQYRGFDVVLDVRALDLERKREANLNDPDKSFLRYIDACVEGQTLRPAERPEYLPQMWEWARERPKRVADRAKVPDLPIVAVQYTKWVNSPSYYKPGIGIPMTTPVPEIVISYFERSEQVWREQFTPHFGNSPKAMSSLRNQTRDAVLEFFKGAKSLDDLAALGVRNTRQAEQNPGIGTITKPRETEAKPRGVLLPPFKEELRGSNPVRLRNPNVFAVVAGIRAGDSGKDFEVPANGVDTVYIPNGKYDIYFVYSDKPDALFQGDAFTLNDSGVEIQIVKVVNGNYGIRQVK